MVYSITDIDLAFISNKLNRYGIIPRKPKRKPDRAGGRDIVDVVCAFDIETSTVRIPDPNREIDAHSFMYIWQFQLDDATIIGRTWEEYISLLDYLVDAIQAIRDRFSLDREPMLIIYVHNLSYEFAFLRDWYPFGDNEIFLRDSRKPLYCRMFDCIEYRCSFLLTNMSLAHFCKQMDVKDKLSGQKYDYNKVRFPWTELTDYEIEYCVTDVQSLVEGLKVKMRRDGDTLQSIPLTSTGYVRRECKEAVKPYRVQIHDMRCDVDSYKMLRLAFRGGNTHANRQYVGKILDNVQSWDMSSCYPAQQLTKRFPMGKWRFLDKDRCDLQHVFKFAGLGYAVVAEYVFEDLKLKDGVYIPYISLARTKSSNFKLDNGRVLYASYCELVLTELDLEIVFRQYNFKKVHINRCMAAQKAFLPEEYREVIRNYFRMKTAFKGIKDPETVYMYQKSKNKLNAIFGMACQDPIHAEVYYCGGDYWEENLYNNEEKANKVLAQAPFPYGWGVYTTAYARSALQEAIDLACDRIVYCDTDSVKLLGKLDGIEKINNEREKKAVKNGAFADDPAGERHFMGVFEYEGMYEQFITQGAKRYAYIIDGKMGVTVSGVSRKINEETGVSFAVEELKSLDRFKNGMEWKKAGGSIATYNDDDNIYYPDPETGEVVHIGSNVAITDRTYRMGFARDYRDLLLEIVLYGDYIDSRE